MILDDIVAKKKIRLDKIDDNLREDVEKKAYESKDKKSFSFFKALSKKDLSYIAEVKRASPSKGLICEKFNPLLIAKEYEKINVDAISVLSEQDFFQGSPKYIKEISEVVNKPILRKDFIIDKFQIHEAKMLNSSAILLICSLLSKKELKDLYIEATNLNLDVLVESHNREELDKALFVDAKIIGINNRNLKTFKVDLNTSKALRKYIPNNKVMVSESGFSNREDILKAQEIGVDAVLIGESFMKSTSKENLLNSFKGLSK